VVQVAQEEFRGGLAEGQAPERGADGGHQQAWAQPVAADVGDGQANAARGQLDYIVVVAARGLGGPAVSGQFVAPDLGQGAREEAGLDLLGYPLRSQHQDFFGLEFTDLPKCPEDFGHGLGKLQIALQQILVRGPLGLQRASQAAGHVQSPAGRGIAGQRSADCPVKRFVRREFVPAVPDVPTIANTLAAAKSIEDQPPARLQLLQPPVAAGRGAHLHCRGIARPSLGDGFQPDDRCRCAARNAPQ
jgi:hypothetical protein